MAADATAAPLTRRCLQRRSFSESWPQSSRRPAGGRESTQPLVRRGARASAGCEISRALRSPDVRGRRSRTELHWQAITRAAAEAPSRLGRWYRAGELHRPNVHGHVALGMVVLPRAARTSGGGTGVQRRVVGPRADDPLRVAPCPGPTPGQYHRRAQPVRSSPSISPRSCLQFTRRRPSRSAPWSACSAIRRFCARRLARDKLLTDAVQRRELRLKACARARRGAGTPTSCGASWRCGRPQQGTCDARATLFDVLRRNALRPTWRQRRVTGLERRIARASRGMRERARGKSEAEKRIRAGALRVAAMWRPCGGLWWSWRVEPGNGLPSFCQPVENMDECFLPLGRRGVVRRDAVLALLLPHRAQLRLDNDRHVLHPLPARALPHGGAPFEEGREEGRHVFSAEGPCKYSSWA